MNRCHRFGPLPNPVRHLMLAAGIVGMISLALVGCSMDMPGDSGQATARGLAYYDWSPPVHLDGVNSSSGERNPVLSWDGRTLYFASDRPGGAGGFDIYVSQRSSWAAPWGTPQNLAALNSPSNEFTGSLSLDGRLLFFGSNRAGSTPNAAGAPSADIYVAHRTDPRDDFNWDPPTMLGDGVNTADQELSPFFLRTAEEGPVNLYFNRGNVLNGGGDIYCAAITRSGETMGPATPVTELNAPAPVSDAGARIRLDGREMFFYRHYTTGISSLYTSTRRSVRQPWLPPVPVSGPLNDYSSAFPSLSLDARTLIFGSDRPEGLGAEDLWMSTRTLGWE